MEKIVLLDDEKHCTDILRSLILKTHHNYEIIGDFNDPAQALEFVKNNEVDLLFLDIHMPGMNGFKFLDAIQPISFDVIFTTAFDQYAIKAFEYSAINYLLKPITEKALIKALLTREQRKKKMKDEHWDVLKNAISDTEKEPGKIALPTGTGFEIMEVGDIVRCQSENNYTTFVFKEGKRVLICRTLKEVEKILACHSFLRVHQSHLINPKFVQTISKQDGGTVFMADDSEVPISRQKKESINELLSSMLHFD